MTQEDQLASMLAEINRGAKVIYEAAFSFNNVFVKVDIIVPVAKTQGVGEGGGSLH